MTGMNIQERYDDISKISGLSEEIIRRVFKATRQSLAKSLKQGERATLPGICTLTPELKNRIDIGGESMTTYIKLKASASSAMETELGKISNFDITSENDRISSEEKGLQRLRLTEDYEIARYQPNKSQIRTTQINALL